MRWIGFELSRPNGWRFGRFGTPEDLSAGYLTITMPTGITVDGD
jgi:hypothetical protein